MEKGVRSFDGTDDPFLSLSFASKYNGPGIVSLGRPSVCVSVVLDVSGSMSCTFEDDVDRQSKLEVAKQSIAAICQQLGDKDEAALVIFNHDQVVALPVTKMNAAGRKRLMASARDLRAGGGTSLCDGYDAGMELINCHGSEADLKRVIFITDMESGPHDEAAVIASARKAAQAHGVHTTVMGVGVDLSVATVEQLSCIPGGRYMSACSSGDFSKVLAEDFSYDVTPIAFDINIQLVGADYTLDKGFGSPEVNGIKPGAQTVVLSSEFATPQAPDGSSSGILLFKLRNTGGGGAATPVRVAVSSARLERARFHPALHRHTLRRPSVLPS